MSFLKNQLAQYLRGIGDAFPNYSKRCITALGILLLPSTEVFAHATGENYIFLSISKEGVATGNFTFHRSDLAEKLGIELTPGTTKESNGFVSNSASQVHDYIKNRFSMSAEGAAPVDIQFTGQSVMEDFPAFVEYHFRAEFGFVPEIIDFKHELMYENDQFHRGMICLNYNPLTDTHYPEETVALIFNRIEDVQQLDLRKPIKDLLMPKQFIWQGILHIWIGIDHMLFLVVLILPAVLMRKKGVQDKFFPYR
ncbi:MAG: hypothetical protein O3C43_06555 [Verrucomicrobia bacterium]|nr:hypothetical protein [Verrucomicrobiota bacterium]